LEWVLGRPTLARILGVGGSAATRELTDGDDDEVRATQSAYRGVRQASEYLRSQNVERQYREQVLQSFEIDTINVRSATASEYGLRYYDGVEASAKGHNLFNTFPASRQSLALKLDWNAMTDFTQWRIRVGTTIIEGRAAAQGTYLPGGQWQMFVLNLEDLISP